jgi:hypothetical protein
MFVCAPQESCDLSLGFQQLPGLLLQLLDLLVRQPSTYLSRLMMQSDGSGAMEFAQVLPVLISDISHQAVCAVIVRKTLCQPAVYKLSTHD